MSFKFSLHSVPVKRIFFILIALAVLGAVFGVGLYVGMRSPLHVSEITGIDNKTPPIGNPDLQNADFGLFWSVWNQLQARYVDQDKLDKQKMIYGAISGLVNALGDPYTVFFPPQESKQFAEEIKGSFGGIGAEIGIKKGVLTIVAPLKDSPAEKIGLKAKDSVIKIDGKDTSSLTVEEAVRLIRGPKGTNVKLTIFRESFDAPKDFTITRDDIKIPTVKYESKGDNIYYIALYNFNETAGMEFRKALQAFRDSGHSKLIIDLRNNPGGYLSNAVDIASFFTPAGTVIVRERYESKEEDVYRSAGYDLFGRTKVVILVNGGSASASEILAGALRDINHVQLIGEKTFGKGSVQELVNMSDGTSLKVTIAKWLTPNGNEINGVGLEPDIKVEIPTNPEEGKDYTLDKAIEVLKAK